MFYYSNRQSNQIRAFWVQLIVEYRRYCSHPEALAMHWPPLIVRLVRHRPDFWVEYSIGANVNYQNRTKVAAALHLRYQWQRPIMIDQRRFKTRLTPIWTKMDRKWTENATHLQSIWLVLEPHISTWKCDIFFFEAIVRIKKK